MRDHGPRPRVLPGVPRFVPYLHIGEARVDALRIDKERGDCHGTFGPRARGNGAAWRAVSFKLALFACG